MVAVVGAVASSNCGKVLRRYDLISIGCNNVPGSVAIKTARGMVVAAMAKLLKSMADAKTIAALNCMLAV
jgi:adenosylcobinamide amidohydrolase